MTFDAVPWIIDGTQIDAEVIRRALGTLMASDGIVTPGDLALSQTTVASMSVQMAVGEIWVKGTSSTAQGPYYGRNGATVTLTHNAADGSLPRIDTWVAEVIDPEYVGGTVRTMEPVILPGTPTSGASYPSNTSGAAAVPASAKVIGYVNVAAGATSISNADITTVVSRFTIVTGGANGGLATLDSTGKVPAGQLGNILTCAEATPTRALSTAYQPNTTRPTLVLASLDPSTVGLNIQVGPTAGSVATIASLTDSALSVPVTFIVAPGYWYEITPVTTGGTPAVNSVTEWTL